MRVAPSGLSQGRDVFRTVHVAALVLCAIALPWSKALLSMAQLLLVANWLVEGALRGDLKGRFGRAFTTAPRLVFLSFFALHLVGLLWTDDTAWGMGLVRILAPVLVFGVVLGSSPRLLADELRMILLLGAWSVAVSTVACLIARHGLTGDYRSLSVFISHIRLTLLLCLPSSCSCGIVVGLGGCGSLAISRQHGASSSSIGWVASRATSSWR